jgi:hypothetical protein
MTTDMIITTSDTIKNPVFIKNIKGKRQRKQVQYSYKQDVLSPQLHRKGISNLSKPPVQRAAGEPNAVAALLTLFLWKAMAVLSSQFPFPPALRYPRPAPGYCPFLRRELQLRFKIINLQHVLLLTSMERSTRFFNCLMLPGSGNCCSHFIALLTYRKPGRL